MKIAKWDGHRSATFQYAYYYPPTDTYTWYTSKTGDYSQNSRVVGDNFPDWRERLRDGRNCTTYLHGKRYHTPHLQLGQIDTEPGRLWFGNHIRIKNGHLGNIPFATSSPFFTSLETSTNIQALTVLNKKLLKTRQGFQSGTFFGEIAETLHQIRNPANGLFRGLFQYHGDVRKLLKRRNISSARAKRASGISSEISGLWLENVFGWQPLLSDIRDGAETLARLELGHYGVRRRVVGSAFDKIVEFGSTVSNNNVDYAPYHYSVRKEHSVRVIYRAGVGAAPFSTDSAQQARDLFGISWSEFLPTIWEIIPYSFLADYFLNIGNVLSAWSHQNYGQNWVNKTVIKQVDAIVDDCKLSSVVQSNINTGFITGVSYVPYEVTRRYREVVRDNYTGSLVPDFQFTIPGFRSSRWFNIAALARLRLP